MTDTDDLLKTLKESSGAVALQILAIARLAPTEAPVTPNLIERAMLAIAIPHWADEGYLATALAVPNTTAEKILRSIARTSFVERRRIGDETAYAVHDTTRTTLRQYLRATQFEEFKKLSFAAERHLASMPQIENRIRRIYHQYSFDEYAGSECKLLCCDLLNTFDYQGLDLLASCMEELSAEADHSPTVEISLMLPGLELAHVRGRLALAAEAISKLWDMRTEVNDPSVNARMASLVAEIFRTRGQLAKARLTQEEAVGLARTAPILKRWAVADTTVLVTCLTRCGDVMLDQGQSAEALMIFTEAFNLCRSDPLLTVPSEELQVRIGDISLRRGHLTEALRIYESSLTSFYGMEAASSTSDCSEQIVTALVRIGDVHEREGRLSAALEYMEKAIGVATTRLAKDPANTAIERIIGITYSRRSDILDSLGRVGEATEAASRYLEYSQAIASFQGRNHALFREVQLAHAKRGMLYLKSGKTGEARRHLELSAELSKRLTELDPTNAIWQLDYAISHARIADVDLEHGNYDSAVEGFERFVRLMENLTERDLSNTDWQRELAVAKSKLADGFARLRRYHEAIDLYKDSAGLLKRLCELDPTNAAWRRELLIGQLRIGDGYRKVQDYTTAIAIYDEQIVELQRLAIDSAENFLLKQDVAVAHGRRANALLAVGELEAARAEWSIAAEMLQHVSDRDPSNLEWREQLGITLREMSESIIDVRPKDAIVENRRSLEIFRNLVLAAPSNAVWLREHAISLRLEARALKRIGDRRSARKLLLLAHERLSRALALGRSDVWTRELATISREVKDLR